MLFSQKNLESDMKVGFKGNPNIGSVVLNQFADSAEFKSFANDFQQGDKVFIISSIFGGTGIILPSLRTVFVSA
ncbi:Sll0445 protein [Mucinivorans hirudinis]|uniref:Sll0445 protein n=1 Tax=Mucinivorans hirudinis TaxID=1433126 RepID=A0A060R8H3_9BACT|nr:Sll0445 protein [Mucinivorans hirudinis]